LKGFGISKISSYLCGRRFSSSSSGSSIRRLLSR
jgi:hypothetical protein